jgi:Protein of unknown function (DUF2891)
VTELTLEVAAQYVELAAAGARREYPNAPQFLLGEPADLVPPRTRHPAFYGCYDWHSAVHTHWLLARLGRRYEPLAPIAGAVLGEHLTPEYLAAELAYFEPRPWFERPYGIGWLLALAAELPRWPDAAAGSRWAAAVAPLADLLADRLAAWVAAEPYPIRHGAHGNTAFAMVLAHDAVPALRGAMAAAALRWYGDDVAYDGRYEPSAHDFVSPGLTEAVLMSRVLARAEFAAWLDAFLPDLWRGGTAVGERAGALLAPVTVTDRADPQGVHRDGLNLSRAWCLRELATAIGPREPVGERLSTAARAHLAAALPYVASGEFVGEHWLPTFAVLALT